MGMNFYDKCNLFGFLDFYIKGNNIGMKNCKQCGYRLSSYGNNYYCCNKQEPVCSSCRIDPCKKCKQRRVNIVQPSKCNVCWGRIDDGKGFKQATYGKEYCSKCLSKTFNQAVKKTLFSNNNASFSNSDPIKLPCGNICRFIDLVTYFKDFCLQCGKDYRENLDLELKDGLKLCYLCDSYFHDKYLQSFIKCNICGCCIEKKSKAGILDEQGLTLCRNCYHESQMEENYLEQNKQLNQSRKAATSYSNQKQASNYRYANNEEPVKHSQVKVDSFFHQKKHENSFVQKRFQQSFSERKTQQNYSQTTAQQNVKEGKMEAFQWKKSLQEKKQEEKLPKKQSQVSPLRKIIQKTWMPQGNKSTQQIEKKDQQKDAINEQAKSQKNIETNKAKEQKNKGLKTQQKNQANLQQNFNESFQNLQIVEKQPQALKIYESSTMQVSKKQQGSLEYFVTNKLINQDEQVDQKIKEQLGISDHLVLKKFLSDQTLVENLTLEIPQIESCTFVKCDSCSTKLPINLAYNLDAKPQSKPKSSALLCISSLQESLISSKAKDATYNCRVCYHKMTQARKKQQKSRLEESISTNDRSFRTNAPQRSFLTDSRITSDYMNASNMSNVSQRRHINPSSNAYNVSPYGLTGAKYQDAPIMRQDQQNSRYQSIKKAQIPIKPSQEKIKLTTKQFLHERLSTPMKKTEEKIKLNTRQFMPERRTTDKILTERCVYCGLDRKQVIHSLDGGKYCTDCYMKKNRLLFSDHSYMRNIY